MANAVEKSCTMLVYNDKQVSVNEIKEALEGSDVEAKVEAMQKAVTMLLNGEQLPQLFITIVRYVLPSEDHAVQKLLLLYLVGVGCCLSCCKQQACNPRLAACPPQVVQDLTVLAWAMLLLLLLQEAIEKTDANGKVLPEMVSGTLPAQQPHFAAAALVAFVAGTHSCHAATRWQLTYITRSAQHLLPAGMYARVWHNTG